MCKILSILCAKTRRITSTALLARRCAPRKQGETRQHALTADRGQRHGTVDCEHTLTDAGAVRSGESAAAHRACCCRRPPTPARASRPPSLRQTRRRRRQRSPRRSCRRGGAARRGRRKVCTAPRAAAQPSGRRPARRARRAAAPRARSRPPRPGRLCQARLRQGCQSPRCSTDALLPVRQTQVAPFSSTAGKKQETQLNSQRKE